MLKTFGQLIAQMLGIKNEDTPGANSAVVVGQALEDLAENKIQEFDPSYSYKAGQTVAFQGVLATATAATSPGQTPLSHRGKWSIGVALSVDEVAIGSTKPVSAGVLALLIQQGESGESADVPAATPDTPGKVRGSTDQQVLDGEGDGYVSAEQLALRLAQFNQAVDSAAARNIDFDYVHDEQTDDLAITVAMPVQPEMRIEGHPGASSTFVAATAGNNPNTWEYVFANITQSCRVRIREVGSMANGISAPVRLDTLNIDSLLDSTTN